MFPTPSFETATCTFAISAVGAVGPVGDVSPGGGMAPVRRTQPMPLFTRSGRQFSRTVSGEAGE